jgi:hypothetical protein
MTELVKMARLAGFLVGLLTPAASELRAAQPEGGVFECQAVVTELSANASATTYWLAESDGWHVVTTVDIFFGRVGDAEQHAVVRFRGASAGPGGTDLCSLCPRRATAGPAYPPPR